MKIAKKLLAIFLVALMLITAVPVTDTGWFENVEAHAASITIENSKTDFIQYADRIKISVVGGAKGNWVGVFPSTAGDSGYIAWSYWETGDAKYYDFAGNDNEYLTGINTDYYITGDNGYRYLKKGTYNFRFFNSSGTKLVTSSNFTVYDYPKTTKQSYSCNETITVKCSSGMYTGNPGHAAVRIYDVGTYDNGSISSNNYKYSARIGGQNQTKTITNPGPGDYYVVFFKFDNDYSYDHVGSKYKFTVTGHSWDNGTVTKAATCTEDGTKTYKCKNNSSHTKTETIAKLGHSWNAATCTTAKTCSVCKATSGNALGHSYSATGYTWSSDYKTCTASGKCSRCNGTTSVKTTSITNSLTTNPGCTSNGVRTYKATFSGSDSWAGTTTKTQSISATGHTPGAAATCTTAQTCTVCKATIANAKGHTYIAVAATPATCLAGGYNAHYKCSVCSKRFATNTNATSTDYKELSSFATAQLAHEDTNKDHICDRGCGVAQGTHADGNNDHVCDYGCSVKIGTHADGNNDHNCDYGCSVKIGEHVDGNKDHNCDYGCSDKIGTCEDKDLDHKCDYGCSVTYGEHKDVDPVDHVCDYGCKVTIGTCEDKDLDHKCDHGCDKVYGIHEDVNPVDHVCDYGCKVTIGTCEDKDLDHKCDHGCDKVYGEHKDSAEDKDHVCDYCKSEQVLEVCKDAVGDKDHNCDVCGEPNITDHTYGEWVLTTAPTADADGEYTKTCSECEDKVTKAVKLADYTELEEVIKALEDIKNNNSNLTDASKEAIDKALEKANGVPGDLPADVVEDEEVVIRGKQGVIDSVVDELNIKLEEINNSVENGTGLKADYTAYDEIVGKLNELKATEDLKSEYVDEIVKALEENAVEPGLTSDKQGEINDKTAALEAVFDRISEKVADKSALKADYSELEKAIARLEEAKKTEGLTTEAVERLNDALEEATATLASGSLTQSAEDTEILNKAVDDANKAAVITGADLKADYSALNEAIENLEKALATEGLTDAAKERLNDALEAANSVDKNLTQSAEDTEILNKAVDDANKAAMLTDKDFIADYEEYIEARTSLEVLLTMKDLKSEFVEEVKKALDDNQVADNLTRDQQSIIDAATENLKAIDKAIWDKINDGSALDANTTELENIIEELQKILDSTDNLTDDAEKDIQDAINAAQGVVEEDLSQSDEDLKKLEDAIKDAQDALDNANDKIEDGSALKADYTDLDKAIENLEKALAKEGLTDAAKDRLNDALEAAKAVDRNLTQSDADKKTIADAAKAANEAAVLTDEDYKVNKDAFNNAVAAFNALGDIVTKADKETVKNLVSEIDSIPDDGSKAQYQNTVDTAATTVTNIVAKYKECAAGNHRDENKDHACDYGCTVYQGKHEDSADDEDHVCDYGCGATLENCSDIAGDNDHSCDVCGTSDVTAHSYKAVVTLPTCTADGYTTHTCEECGDSYTDTPVTALGHKDGEAVVENDVKPTCTDDGSYDTVTYCTVCKEETSRKTTVVTALGHKDGEAVVENDVKPTCTDDGSYDTVTYCTVCKEETSRKTTVVTALGHKDGEAVVENDVKPTCTDDGSYDTVTYCTVCKEETSRKTTVVTALGHKEIKHDAKAPDCDDYGWDAYVTCSRCDYTTYKEIPATGHTEVVDKAVSATCTETGLTEGKHCSVCKEVLVKQTVVPAKGHSEVILEAKKATCTETGLTEGKKCSVCKEVLVEQTVIKMLPHTAEYVPGRAPTCSQVGLTAGEKCSVCSTVIVKQNTIEKLPHTEQIIPGREATCTLVGYKEGKQCSVCKEVIVPREKIDKLPHDFKIAVTNATCEEDGYKTRTCSMCLVSEVIEVYRATGHNFQNGKCTNCGSNNVHNCSHMCHKEGFFGFIWMIVNFFYRFFNLQQYCDCGLRHYEKPIIAWPW